VGFRVFFELKNKLNVFLIFYWRNIMKTLINKISAFLADEQGAETVEWVMIAAILAAIIIFAFNTTLRNGVNAAINKIVTSMNSAG
jgi:Flp pilus assembly pilin Flp